MLELVAANQFISDKSQINVVAIKSWFTLNKSKIFEIIKELSLHIDFKCMFIYVFVILSIR